MCKYKVLVDICETQGCNQVPRDPKMEWTIFGTCPNFMPQYVFNGGPVEFCPNKWLDPSQAKARTRRSCRWCQGGHSLPGLPQKHALNILLSVPWSPGSRAGSVSESRVADISKLVSDDGTPQDFDTYMQHYHQSVVLEPECNLSEDNTVSNDPNLGSDPESSRDSAGNQDLETGMYRHALVRPSQVLLSQSELLVDADLPENLYATGKEKGKGCDDDDSNQENDDNDGDTSPGLTDSTATPPNEVAHAHHQLLSHLHGFGHLHTVGSSSTVATARSRGINRRGIPRSHGLFPSLQAPVEDSQLLSSMDGPQLLTVGKRKSRADSDEVEGVAPKRSREDLRSSS